MDNSYAAGMSQGILDLQDAIPPAVANDIITAAQSVGFNYAQNPSDIQGLLRAASQSEWGATDTGVHDLQKASEVLGVAPQQSQPTNSLMRSGMQKQQEQMPHRNHLMGR